MTKTKDNGIRWWHRLPQCSVGDLVRYRSTSPRKFARRGRNPWLVIAVDPKKPCRSCPSQIVTVFDSTTGKTSKFAASNLEVLNEMGT